VPYVPVEQSSTVDAGGFCTERITGKTLSQRRKWVEATSPSDRLSDLHHP